MNEIISKKIKKYVLYISTVFFVVFGIHLCYSYLYDGAESIAEEGGTISEAIIGSFPHLNPLLPSNDHNGYINSLLYRSLLEYSTESESFESDLVSCNLSNLLYIECILENNLKWSDGSSITTEDIKSTFNIISKTKVNPIIASLLENTTIETTEDSISFSNTTKDINFLHIFLQPILPGKIIEELDSENIEGKFSEINGVYSGRFVLSNISQDETVGITKITFGKNDQYFGNTLYVNFLILNLFRDEAHFLKNKNSFNIYNDKDNIIGGSIPRLESYPYTLSQFVGVFFNTDNLGLNLRSYISENIERTDYIEQIGKNNILPTYNPFLSSTNIDIQSDNYILSEAFNNEGYYAKKDLLKDVLLQQENSKIEEEAISNEALVEESNNTKQIIQSSLEYIKLPNNDKYNFISEDNVLIQGKVDSGVSAVYINDYKLSGFSEGDDIFYYRLLESYDSIVEGENTYTLYFEENGVKREIESFTYVYYTDQEKLNNIKDSFFTISEVGQNLEEEQEENNPEDESTQTIGTKLSAEKIETLDERFYYNESGESRSITIVYAQTDIYMDSTINILQNQLASIGIDSNVKTLNLGDITVGLRNETLDYDIMVIGINLGYFSSNIFPYFHSSQIQNGYNIANFKKLSLDILLEELKSNNLSVEKRIELEEKMLDIIKEESVVKVLYTPKISLLVDKNIKNFTLPSYLPDSKHRSYPLTSSYLSEKRIIEKNSKGFFGFIEYITRNLFNPNGL